MSQLPIGSRPYLQPIKSDNTKAVMDGAGQATLESSTTYYVPLSTLESLIEHLHLTWSNSIVFTSIEVETSSLADADAPVTDTTVGDWIKEDPTGAYVAVAGSGVTATLLTLAGTASSVGGASIHLGNLGSRRSRLKVVIGATGGTLRVAAHGKD